VIPVLSVASEIAPFIKTGGLADVTGAMPRALAPEGFEVVTLVPLYGDLFAKISDEMTSVAGFEHYIFGGSLTLKTAKTAVGRVLMLEAPHLFGFLGNPYVTPYGDRPDGDIRFAALAWAGAMIARDGVVIDGKNWRPRLVQCHDWQAALVPEYVRQMGGDAITILTVHNSAFQGITTPERLPLLHLSGEINTIQRGELGGGISMLKAGLTSSSAITTVSKTFARELITPQFGFGLEGVFASRSRDLYGIVNGLDCTVWDPASDPHILSIDKPSDKAPNRERLLERFGLGSAKGPVFGVVSRLTHQKGLDVLLEALPVLLDYDARLVLVGSGDSELEYRWQMAAQSSEHVAVHIGFDEAIASQVYAGADSIIVPSRFEPCGLTQLIGLRYGAIPIVTQTGGLADTVIPWTPMTDRVDVATGIMIRDLSVASLMESMVIFSSIHGEANKLDILRHNALSAPVGWEVAAKEYAGLFNYLMGHA
jgi:starch synthase